MKWWCRLVVLWCGVGGWTLRGATFYSGRIQCCQSSSPTMSFTHLWFPRSFLNAQNDWVLGSCPQNCTQNVKPKRPVCNCSLFQFTVPRNTEFKLKSNLFWFGNRGSVLRCGDYATGWMVRGPNTNTDNRKKNCIPCKKMQFHRI